MVNHPQENSVDLLRRVLEERFHNESGGIDSLMALVSQRGDVTVNAIIQLAEAAGDNVNLFQYLLNDRQVSSLRQAATRICSLGLTSLAPNPQSAFPKVDLIAFRGQLLLKEPTALLYGLLESDAFPVDAEPRKNCQGILKKMQSADLNMSKDSVRGVLNNSEYMVDIPEQQHKQVVDMLAKLQRLQAIVFDPDDIARLLRASFNSASSIAQTTVEGFRAAVGPQGIDAETATRIYQQSGVVQRRNEQVWIKTLTARNEIPLIAAAATNNNDQPVNLSNLFKDLIQSTQCSDCSSITSPAAYFVDFLQTLTQWPRDKKPNDKSLRDRLFERRPDLGNLHLSCSNTLVPLPYIDLVNEALESVIAHSQAVVTDVYDEDDSCDTGELIEPQHIAYDVYHTIIQPQLFPLGTFPYNFAVDSIRGYFRAFGVSRYGTMQVLQSTYRLAKNRLSVSDRELAQEVLDRYATAEYLGLQEEDYIAVTGEAVQTSKFLGITDKANYEKRIALQPTYAYWGYGSNNDMMSLDEGPRKGLVFIREQFLPRSELSFEQLLDLLRSSFLNGRIVIEMFDGSAKFSGKVDDMRLRQVGNGGTTGPLDESMCHRLQAFVRLRKKLGWSVHDTAVVLTALGSADDGVITPATLNELAALKRLADETSMPATRLLPLWGNIDTFEPGSLYASLFLPSKLNPANAIFQADRNGQYLPSPPAKLSNNIAVVLAALQMSAVAYNAIQKATNMSDELTIGNLSLLYRVSMFCAIIGIRPDQFPSFLSLGYTNYLASPTQTLQRVRQYRALIDAGWTLEKLLRVIGTNISVDDGFSEFDIGDVVSATNKLVTWNASRKSWSDGSSQGDSPAKITPAVVAQTVRSFFPRLPDEIMQYMLSDLLTIGNGESIVDALSKLRRPDVTGQSFDGHFTPPVTGTYSFSVVQPPTTPELTISGVTVEFKLDGGSNIYESQQPRRLLSGQAYRIKWKGGPITNLRWTIGDAKPVPFNDTALVDEASVILTMNALVKLAQVAQLVDTCTLTVDEVHYYQQHVNGFDFNKITRQNVEDLLGYTRLRPHSSDGASSPLLALRKWLSSPSDANAIASQLAKFGGWTETHVAQVLSAHYPTMKNADIVSAIQDIPSLSRLQDAIKLTANFAIPNLSPGLLYKLSEPTAQPEDGVDVLFDNAKSLRAASQSNRSPSVQAANNVLRENRRAALVAYLLQQSYIRDRYHLRDADALFEHFLIDVQMGSGFKTSRLKQAISVIQLYVQRCMLGLEESYGVPRTIIKREEWDLIMRYRLWEANRKAYLYPENWIDPTLRDDKTEQFMAMETSVLRKKLTNDVIEEAMTGFIHSIDDVAHLEVQAYLWEHRANSGTGLNRDQGCVHLFARTATTPSSYYYRRVDIRGPKVDPVVFWRPWTKMDVGIVAQETDSEGCKLPKPGVYLVPVVFKGRLYLFIPHFTLKTIPMDTKDQPPKNFQALSEKPPYATSAPQKQIWELSMGWSEFKSGKWTAKRVAHKALHIAAGSSRDPVYSYLSGSYQTLAEIFPSITSFQFSTRVRSVRPIYGTKDVDILTIDIDRWLGSGAPGERELSGFVAYPLGRFELRGQQLVLEAPDTSFTGKGTVPTDFMRLSWPANRSDDLPNVSCDRYGGKNMRPMLAEADEYGSSLTYTWILSLNFVNGPIPSGLVANVATQDDSHTFMIYPPWAPRYADFDTINLHNKTSPIFLEIFSLGGGLKSLYDSLSSLPQDLYGSAFGDQHGKVFHEQADPYALHSWETGVHAVSLLMERLKATGQHELALSIGRLAFDPSWEDPKLGKVWHFPPFRDPNTRDSLPSNPDPTWENKWAIMEWNMNPATIHAAARGHPVAYMKRLAIKYMEVLIDAGDNLFRLNTLESIPLALQRYVEASHIFGPVPIQVPELGKHHTLTYNQLASKTLDPLSNRIIDLELDFPFQSDPKTRGTSTSTTATSMAYIETGYFCIPSNPQVMGLKNLIEDRMFKIRNNLDIDGNIQDRPLFEPPIDPGQLVRAHAAGVSPSAFANDIKGPMPKHRFMYLLQRAYQMAEELKSMDTLILSIKERKDSEALLKLTTSHRLAVQQLIFESKKAEKKEALKAIDVLKETRGMHEQRLSFFLALTGDSGQGIPGPETAWRDIPQLIDKPTADDLRMGSSEKLEMDCTESAVTTLPAISVLENIAADLLVFPQATINAQPLGIGVSTEIGTGIAARALQAAAGIVRAKAQHDQDQGMLAGKKSYLIRQLQERRQQANQAGRDIKLVDQQVLVQKLQVERLAIELRAQEQDNENTAQELEWFQSKYTNEQLYTWLENQYATVYQDTYTLASQLAKKVQKAYYFENPQDDTAYLNPVAGGYWDSSRDGLLSGARLSLDLKRIEMAYMNSQSHDFEIEKTVSLRQLHPLGLLSIRETGEAEFNLPETLFDIDFPGHYCRRIVSVSLRIPCIVGAYVGLNCTLTLKSHTYRVSKSAINEDDYLNTDKKGAFRTDVIPITSIAVTSSHHDGGRFDFGSYSEKYLPFEGAGAISTWRVELPKKLRQFNYETISDVIMQLRYTSFDGGQTLKTSAQQATMKVLKDATGDDHDAGLTLSPSAIIDIACDYADQWYPFTQKLKGDKPTDATLRLIGIDGYLPFWTQGFKTVKAYRVSLLVMPAIDPTQFSLEKNLVLEGPSGAVAWTSDKTRTMGDCLVLQADNANQDVKAAAGEWNIKFSTAPPSTFILRTLVLVLGYSLT